MGLEKRRQFAGCGIILGWSGVRLEKGEESSCSRVMVRNGQEEGMKPILLE
ncbi:hypothetical protein RSJ42_05965 [Methanosarcina hadiensis]|uniref:hypothetical protein n=1 Tax=Methanosarcina hadiensis TaxID=3078083 RepID=UPI0039776F2B